MSDLGLRPSPSPTSQTHKPRGNYRAGSWGFVLDELEPPITEISYRGFNKMSSSLEKATPPFVTKQSLPVSSSRQSSMFCFVWVTFFFSPFLNFTWTRVTYRIVIISAVWQNDSNIHTHTRSFSDSFLTEVITEYWVEFLVLNRQPLLTLCHKLHDLIHSFRGLKKTDGPDRFRLDLFWCYLRPWLIPKGLKRDK